MSAGRSVPPAAWLVAAPFLAAGPQFAAATVLGVGLVAAADPVSLAVLVLSAITAAGAMLSTRHRESQRTTIESRAQTTAEHAQRLAELEATAESVGRDRAYWEARALRAEESATAAAVESHRARRDAAECEARLEVAETKLRLAQARVVTLEAEAKGTADER